MLALLRYIQDYHVWEDTICVSESSKLLEDYYWEECDTEEPLLTKEQHEELYHSKEEFEPHYVILEIKFLEEEK